MNNAMNDYIDEIGKLFLKYIRKELTSDESVRLEQWLNESERNRQFFEQTVNTVYLVEDIKDWQQALDEINIREAWEKLLLKYPEYNPTKVVSVQNKWLQYVAAAIVLMIAGYWLLAPRFTKSNKPEVTQQQTKKNDIDPGKYKAMLTLDDGRKIVLDSAVQGELAKEGNALVLNKDGQLVYDASSASPSGEAGVRYNTLTTTRGQTYAATLSDGSKVWLNSQSSIRYPVSFAGNERKVEITGEVYFEVAPSISPEGRGHRKPFIVTGNTGLSGKPAWSVDVLGTHFNTYAYEDEAEVKVTLLEGAVKVSKPDEDKTEVKAIKPGQQAILNKTAQTINVIEKEDPESTIAWIHGKFSFDEVSFASMMRELSRWYNVQIVYEVPVPTRMINGEVDRTLPLSELLAGLEKMGNTHFKIEGRTVKVIP